jgi:DNA-binding transcriptional regulator YhcF (GntR family)
VSPLLIVDAGSTTPPYEQIRAQLAGRIGNRTLATGTRLPTVRALASDLGVAVNTVARAYRELEEAGLIETRGRGGSIVTAGGDRSRERAGRAAVEYAQLAVGLGLDRTEALRIVAAALDGL